MHVFLSEHPSTPVDAHRLPAFCIQEDVDRIIRIRMKCGHHKSWSICSNWDETKVKRASMLTNLLERRTMREFILWVVIVFARWQFVNRAVAGVTDKLAQEGYSIKTFR